MRPFDLHLGYEWVEAVPIDRSGRMSSDTLADSWRGGEKNSFTFFITARGSGIEGVRSRNRKRFIPFLGSFITLLSRWRRTSENEPTILYEPTIALRPKLEVFYSIQKIKKAKF